ncbi:hypothetical protein EVAR_24678_1 [Eumeta japonica]|uniref:Uncharacterized protein n=1 Tax=Eumeta variegata TaxID=151549 RepID=A0A4C1WE78_EUMVA|nr:hypothetical protein EVAR_24678_1 [Eumeta japonica]
MPPIPGFSKFCMFTNLPMGVMIIAYSELCGEIIMALFFFVMLVLGAFKANKTKEKEAPLAMVVTALIMLTLMLVFFGFTVTLISGVQQERPLYVLMYLVMATLFMALSMIPLAFVMWNMAVEKVALYGLIFLLDVYLLMVVWSYFFDLATPDEDDGDKDEDTDEYDNIVPGV